MTMWLVRAGKAGEKEAFALQNNLAVIGWEDLPDLTLCRDRDRLFALLQDTYPTEGRKTHASWQHQIWPIRDTMEIGDLVALPLKSRPAIAFGTVAGPYTYRTDLPGGPVHTRPVRWMVQVPRSEFDPDILFSFGAFLTVCRITRNDAEQRIRATLEQEAWPPAVSAARTAGRSNLRSPTRSPLPLTVADLTERSTTMIRDRIAQRFKGHRLAELVAALLEAQGYHARLSPPGADGGVDILAGRGPLGLDPPRLVVQVKSQDSKLDVRVLRELSGVMSRFQADQGLLVGWGGFNQTVRAEAMGDYFRVRLWDADDLIHAIKTEFHRLPIAIRTELPLKQVWVLSPEAAGERAVEQPVLQTGEPSADPGSPARIPASLAVTLLPMRTVARAGGGNSPGSSTVSTAA